MLILYKLKKNKIIYNYYIGFNIQLMQYNFLA